MIQLATCPVCTRRVTSLQKRRAALKAVDMLSQRPGLAVQSGLNDTLLHAVERDIIPAVVLLVDPNFHAQHSDEYSYRLCAQELG